jgi:protoheme IX farnesyltransferase
MVQQNPSGPAPGQSFREPLKLLQTIPLPGVDDPHFMAIAWMYREDYARAGYQILPSGKYQVRFMAWQTVLPLLALLSVTFVSMVLNHPNPVFGAGIFLLSLYFLYCAARLALTRTSDSARRLLLISVFYLPLVFVLQICAGV